MILQYREPQVAAHLVQPSNLLNDHLTLPHG